MIESESGQKSRLHVLHVDFPFIGPNITGASIARHLKDIDGGAARVVVSLPLGVVRLHKVVPMHHASVLPIQDLIGRNPKIVFTARYIEVVPVFGPIVRAVRDAQFFHSNFDEFSMKFFVTRDVSHLVSESWRAPV